MEERGGTDVLLLGYDGLLELHCYSRRCSCCPRAADGRDVVGQELRMDEISFGKS